MSIVEKEMYMAFCDKCKGDFEARPEPFTSWYELLKALREAGWLYDAKQEITICKGCREEI